MKLEEILKLARMYPEAVISYIKELEAKKEQLEAEHRKLEAIKEQLEAEHRKLKAKKGGLKPK